MSELENRRLETLAHWRRNGLRVGDLVRVKTEREILSTLDADGRYEALPFMPEMNEFCGRRLRVSKRADKVCVEGASIRRMKDVVLLEDVRCNGHTHDGCDRMCTIFWKEAWLEKVQDGGSEAPPIEHSIDTPEVRFSFDPQKTYSCQSTALLQATQPLRGWDLRQYIADVKSGNHTLSGVVRVLLISFYNLVVRYTGGAEYGAAVGQLKKTPAVSLDLQPGQIVQVLSREEILGTIDKQGRNRGLSIDFEMLRHAGKTFRVIRRVERIILETTGRMRRIENTVLLEGTACEGLCRRACARGSYPMWREAWLKRVQ